MLGVDSELIDERYNIICERIAAISGEEDLTEPLLSYFRAGADLICTLAGILDRSLCGGISGMSVSELETENHELYKEILPENYEKSYANPDYLYSLLDDKNLAGLLCFLYTEIRGLIPAAFEGKKEIFTLYAELFSEVYTSVRFSALDMATDNFETDSLLYENLKDIVYWFMSDNCDIIVPDRVRGQIDPDCDFARRIIMEEDLFDDRYLYLFGEYVSKNELETARFLRNLSDEEIKNMADTFSEGYRIGFVKAGKPLDKKKTVDVRYRLGFERVTREAIKNFEAMGLKATVYRAATLSLNKKGAIKIGYEGGNPNEQYDYDHKDDEALYLDADFVTRKSEVLKESYESMRDLAAAHAGPAVQEVYGQDPFTPKVKESAIKHSDRTGKLSVDYSSKAAEIVNRYIIGEERSFTIISYPIPEIGKDYEEIFRETVRLNTLPYELYEEIQSGIIDILDRADYVEIKGAKENETDLRIALCPLKNPEHETKFENCVADVNIPVGEVFTSPKLSGTNGVLHVTKVYLNGLLYKNLKITLSDGMVTDYSCSNYESEEENRKYIRENLMFKHDTLPIGEFAIGTNTVAYKMARTYDIEGRLPILIGEKTGPHFALGDTCYSYEEDVKVYNPDGKEIIARENEVSAKRHTNMKEAYFQCHTDITIPYDELGGIYAVVCRKNKDIKEKIAIIENGLFSPECAKELNKPLL